MPKLTKHATSTKEFKSKKKQFNWKIKSYAAEVITRSWYKSISHRIRLTRNGNEEINNKRERDLSAHEASADRIAIFLIIHLYISHSSLSYCQSHRLKKKKKKNRGRECLPYDPFDIILALIGLLSRYESAFHSAIPSTSVVHTWTIIDKDLSRILKR